MLEASPEPENLDRRAQRSRSALLAAAVRLVSDRGTTAIPVAEFTDAADVSRKVLYLHFADRDGLLVAAAVDLAQRDLRSRVATAGADLQSQMLAATEHFAAHRDFYRPMLTGSCAYAMTSKLNSLFSTLSASHVRQLRGGLDQRTTDDLGGFFAGGASTLVNDWLINAPDPLVAEEMAQRLHRIATALSSIPSEGDIS